MRTDIRDALDWFTSNHSANIECERREIKKKKYAKCTGIHDVTLETRSGWKTTLVVVWSVGVVL